MSQDVESLLQSPAILQKLVPLARSFGIAGEEKLIQTLYLVITSRKVRSGRLHAHLGEVSTAGKSEIARFVLSTLPPSAVLHLGGGASKRALQYAGDLSHQVVFIDEAEELDGELRAFLREAVTRSEVTRLVTQGDPSRGFEAKRYTAKTEGLVLIQASKSVIVNPADETRMLSLHPDVSKEQTDRILDMQAKRASVPTPPVTESLELWRKVQDSLRLCHVFTPYAEALRSFFPSDRLRVRRDFPRLLSLICAHACLYQKQRKFREQDGLLAVEAQFEDYAGVYEVVAPLFKQATKGLTPTQQGILQVLLEHFPRFPLTLPPAEFTTQEAETWAGRPYSTVRDHLLALEALGLLESGLSQGRKLWHLIAGAPPGLDLPTPEQVSNAHHPQTPQTAPVPSYAKAERFTGSGPVTDPQTPQTPEEDVLEI